MPKLFANDECSAGPAVILDRLTALRQVLLRHCLSAAIIPSTDPHLSEYPARRWKARQWFSGFTGSVGTLVVTQTEAALFTDGRYWEQAREQLQGVGVDLVPIAVGATTDHIGWLAHRLAGGQSVAIDGLVLGVALASQLQQHLKEAGIELRTDLDVVGEAWGACRPELPVEFVYEHSSPWVKVTRMSKLQAIRKAMLGHGATHHFVSTLDDIAWVTNLRGTDVSYNPVFLAHLLISTDRATLFIADAKVREPLRTSLCADGLTLEPYEAAGDAIAELPKTASVLLDPRRTTLAFRERVPATARVVEACNPSTLLKSRKTDDEVAHIREVMAEDGAAMCEFYAWLQQAMAAGERVTELDVHERLAEARSRRPGFMGLSFNTVAAFNGHGALPHYQPSPKSNPVVEGNGLLLIDSGGQYLGGTTDVTRVWPIGQISDAHRRDFTLVLKGMMNLSRARFPRGTPSPMLDALARAPLWAEGLDYGHGTGHGVGYFLNVHEGPQSISRVLPDATMAFEPGMITSIEPGIYRQGHWGVRIENLALARTVSTLENDEFGEMLEFETLTLCPIDTGCLLPEFLCADELAWLNEYHQMVRERVTPLVAGEALEWLQRMTEKITSSTYLERSTVV